MVDSVVTKQELVDAQKDAKSLEDVINGPADTRVKPRIGPEMWTLATINSLVRQGQIKISDLSEAIQVALAAGAGSAGWTANLVADGNQTQKEINLYGGKKYDMPLGGYPVGAVVRLENGDIVKSTVPNNTNNPNVNMTGWIRVGLKYVTSVSDLTSISNPVNGSIVKTASYNAPVYSTVKPHKGGGTYIYNSSRSVVNDGVLCINGWELASTPDIFSGGVLADGNDDTIALQRTYNALHSLGMGVDLLGCTVKTISLDIDSNTVMENGTLDVYDWAGSVDFPTYNEGNFRRTPIMLKNNPRASPADFEYAQHYTTLVTTENITFRNLKFKAKRRLFTAYKLNELLIEGCDFEWESSEIINVIGGWQGTSYVSDTDTTTNIITPVNGYCENIKIKDNKFRSLTPSVMSSATHFVATRNLTVCNNEYYNVPLGSRIDTWNTEVDVFGNKYLFTDQGVLASLDSDSAAIDSDYIGVYIGQNTHNVNIHGNTFDGVYRPIYVEVGSHVDIWGNNFKNRIGKRWWSYAILLQGNWRDYNNEFWGNTSFVTVRENKFVGFGTAIANSTELPAGRSFGHMDIIVKDNTIIGYSGHGSLLLNRTLNLTCTNNIVEGYAIIYDIGGIQIVSGNNINHQGTDVNTYPLTISNSKGTFFDASKNTIRSNIGACVRLVNTTTSLTNLGGSLLIPSATTNFVSASNAGVVTGVILTPYITSFTKEVLIELADAAVGVYTVAIPNLRYNDIVSVSMSGLTENWTGSGIGLDFAHEPTAGSLNLRVKNISGKAVNFTAKFFIHFQVSVTPL